MSRPNRVLVAALLAACARHDSAGDGRAFQPLSVGDVMPRYDAVSLRGDSVHVGKAGAVTLVNVWATWCTSCREEMEELQALSDQYRVHGMRVVGVSVDQAATAAVARFVDEEHLRFTVVHDRAGEVQQLFSVVGVPSTYLVDASGRLRWQHAGNISEALNELKPVLDSVVEGR